MSNEYEAGWYPSPISLPECSSGPMKIQHRILKTGTKTPIVGIRQAYLRGKHQHPITAVISAPLLIHELVHKDHGTWMTDLPEELNQIEELLFTIKPKGKVLIAGLGLGILAERVFAQPNVTEVTVVEIDQHVINVVTDNVLCDYDIVQADIMEYLRTTNERYDYYLLDTWQGTNEYTWWTEMMPQRRVIRQRWGHKPVVHGWAEDIMQGQIIRNLMMCPPHWYTTHLPVPMKERSAHAFVQRVGTPIWELLYGMSVDKAIEEQGALK